MLLSKGGRSIAFDGSACLWGIQRWRELLSQSEVILELLNDGVTLTGGVLEFSAVHNLHCTSHVFYDALLLQYCRCQAHRGSVSTHHGRNEIVGDRKYSQVHPVLSHQQPSREALLYIRGVDCMPRSVQLASLEAPSACLRSSATAEPTAECHYRALPTVLCYLRASHRRWSVLPVRLESFFDP